MEEYKTPFITSYNSPYEVPKELDPNAIQTAINIIREQRNKLLLETDKYLIIDFPITQENLILIKNYRKELRDFMTIDDIFNTPFPTNPLNKNI